VYTVSDDVKDLFLNNYRQVARITMTHPGLLGEQTITEADILQGGLQIDTYSTSSGKLEVGTAIAAQLTLRLNNARNKFKYWKFNKAELFVEIGIKKWDAYEWENAELTWIPFGRYVVNSRVPIQDDVVNVTALDRMVYLDKPLVRTQFSSGDLTNREVITRIGEICGVTVDVSNLPTTYFLSRTYFSEKHTYRRLVQELAAKAGMCAYFDREGVLKFKWYSTTSVLDLKAKDRYESKIITDRPYITGGTQVAFDTTDGVNKYFQLLKYYYDENESLVAFEISGGGYLVYDVASSLVNTTGVYYATEYESLMFPLSNYNSTVVPTNYTTLDTRDIAAYPFSARIKPMLWLDVMDTIRYVGSSYYKTPITHIRYTMNGTIDIACDIDEQVLDSEGIYIELPSLVG